MKSPPSSPYYELPYKFSSLTSREQWPGNWKAGRKCDLQIWAALAGKRLQLEVALLPASSQIITQRLNIHCNYLANGSDLFLANSNV